MPALSLVLGLLLIFCGCGANFERPPVSLPWDDVPSGQMSEKTELIIFGTTYCEWCDWLHRELKKNKIKHRVLIFPAFLEREEDWDKWMRYRIHLSEVVCAEREALGSERPFCRRWQSSRQPTPFPACVRLRGAEVIDADHGGDECLELGIHERK